ncbi:Anoctamin-10 [Hypsibius exemplaris]|nr:Anoctamin-10 [Hypsibius exemplaris]
METQSESSSQEPFETHCVIELSTKCNADFVEWMIQRIQSPKSQGGAELLVRSVRDVNTNQYAFLHICAPTYRLLMIAEWLELMKPDMQDNEALREFTVKTLSRFVPEGGYPGDLFDYAEKARMVYFEIHELRAKDDETDRFYKTDKIRFSVGQSIITKIQRKDLINQIFSLHEKEVLKLLSKDWISLSFSKKQPLDRIRAYFGEHISIYFAFLGYYTEMLVPATILGFSMFFLQWFSAGSLQSTAAFAIFNVLWATFFFERWKRYCNRLSYKWGVLNKTNQELELPRAQFKGSMGKNPVTGQPEPVYSVVQRNIWIGLVSAPVVTLCLFLTLYILGTYLHTQLRLSEEYLKNPTIMLFFGKFAPSAVYTICINIFRSVYK